MSSYYAKRSALRRQLQGFVVADQYGYFVSEIEEHAITLDEIPIVMTEEQAELIVKRFGWCSAELYVREESDKTPPLYAA